MMEENNLPAITSNQFIEKTKQLSVSLEKTKGEIDGLIRQVSTTVPPVVEGHWYKLGGTSKSDINSALNKVCTIASGSIKLLGEAEAKQNYAINELRQLIQALFLAEAEIYQRVERQYTLNNETANLTNDLGRQLDRSSKQADDLNSAFSRLTEIYKQRAISQNQLKEELRKCSEEISSLKEQRSSNKSTNELKRKIETLDKLISTVREEVHSNFNKTEALISSLTEFKDRFDKHILSITSSIEETAARESAIEQVGLTLRGEIEEQAKASQSALSEHKESVNAQFHDLSEKLEAAANDLKEETSARESAIEQAGLTLRGEIEEQAKASRQAIVFEAKTRSIETNDIKEKLMLHESNTSSSFDSVRGQMSGIVQDASNTKEQVDSAKERISMIERRNGQFFNTLAYKITIGIIAIASLILSILSILGIL